MGNEEEAKESEWDDEDDDDEFGASDYVSGSEGDDCDSHTQIGPTTPKGRASPPSLGGGPWAPSMGPPPSGRMNSNTSTHQSMNWDNFGGSMSPKDAAARPQPTRR